MGENTEELINDDIVEIMQDVIDMREELNKMKNELKTNKGGESNG